MAITNLIVFLNTGIKKLVPLQRENLFFNVKESGFIPLSLCVGGGGM